MAIEIPPDLLTYVVLGWILTLGISVVDALDRRSHRSDIYDLMKLNLSAWQEIVTTPRVSEPSQESSK